MNDGTVAVTSQIGNTAKTTNITGVTHVRAPHSQQVRTDIIHLLNYPAGTDFASGGLPAVSQPSVDYQKGWYSQIPACIPSPAGPSPKNLDTFAFAVPQPNESVVRGQAVPFSVTMDRPSEWSAVAVFVSNTNIASDQVILSNSPCSGTAICPSNLLGSAELVALERSTNGHLRIATVPVLAGLPAGVSLVSMQTEPSAITLDGLGASETIRVTGGFSDSIDRDISFISAGTSYRIGNTNLVAVDGQWHVRALQQGNTWIDVVNGSLSNRVTLTVAFAAPTVLGVWPASVDVRVLTNIPLSISGLRMGGASLVQL